MNVKILLNLLNGSQEKDMVVDDEDGKEFDFLKKYNNRIRSLKVIVVILILFIMIAWSFKGIQAIYQYKNKKYAYDIISSVYYNTQKFKEKENFIYTIARNNIKNIYYYKNGQFKQEIVFDNALGCKLKYGTMKDSDTILINFWDYVKIIDINSIYKREIKEVVFGRDFNYLDNLMKMDLANYGKFIIDEDIYNGKQCYILKEYIGDKEYTMVIDKNEKLIYRYMERNTTEGYIVNKYEYEYSSQIVTDEDIKLNVDKEYFIKEENAQAYLREFL